MSAGVKAGINELHNWCFARDIGHVNTRCGSGDTVAFARKLLHDKLFSRRAFGFVTFGGLEPFALIGGIADAALSLRDIRARFSSCVLTHKVRMLLKYTRERVI